MLFQRELQELQQRQLALRLRNIELRGELGGSVRELLQPLQTARSFMAAGSAGGRGGLGVLGVALTGLGLSWWALRRRPAGAAGGGSAQSLLSWLRLGLRVARLWREFSPAAGRRPPAASGAPDTGL